MSERAFIFCVCCFPPVISASNSPILHHKPSCCKLRHFFGGVGVGVLSQLVTKLPWQGYQPQRSSPRSHRVPKSALPGTRGPTAGPPAHLRRRPGLATSSSIKGAVYIGCHALVLGRVVAASARGNLPSLLGRLPERPMASALLEQLKIVATKVKRSQIEDAVGRSWAVLEVE